MYILNKCYIKPQRQSGMDNPELLAILVIEETGRRQNQNTEH